MKKEETIKSKKEFSDIIKNSKYIKNNEYVIYYNDNNDKTRFGIAISNKIGKAYLRNKLKRQTREIIFSLKSLFKNNTDYIIMIRKGSIDVSFENKKNNLEKLLKEKL